MPDASLPSFPPASGRRTPWAELPASVRGAIEGRLGAQVVAAHSQAGGFSPGLAARLELADGTRAFVKAVCSAPNVDSPRMYRREARVAAALPGDVPAPALRWSSDDGDWVVLAFDDVDGRSPELPWHAGELARVLSAIGELARRLTPSPLALEPASETLAPLFGRWQRILDEGLEGRLPAGARARLDELIALEAGWPAAVRGESLVHLDLRADNILLTPERVFFVDWPAAAIGAAWIDLVLMLPSIAMQGGPAPEDVWRAHPLSRGVDDERVDAVVVAVAGYFAHIQMLPAPPGLPTVREFQAAQGVETAAWLRQRRGWSDFRL
jgi:aminoglycoside phosphotransferase (APT) family kinase protein